MLSVLCESLSSNSLTLGIAGSSGRNYCYGPNVTAKTKVCTQPHGHILSDLLIILEIDTTMTIKTPTTTIMYGLLLCTSMICILSYLIFARIL